MESEKLCKIPLRNRKGATVAWTIVSPEHYEHLNQFRWWKNVRGGYACGKIDGKDIYMHLYIWKTLLNKETNPNSMVDHERGPTIEKKRLDNRIENLRLLTRRQNSENKAKQKNASSKYYGVSWSKISKKWRSRITVNFATFNLGFYDNELAAARAYDCFLYHHLEKDTLMHIRNFPNENFSSEIPFKIRDKYHGVTHKQEMFEVNLTINGKKVYIGTFKTEEEAANASDKAAVNNNLKPKVLNFPEKYPNYVYAPPIKTFKEDIEGELVVRLINDNPKVMEKHILIDAEDYDKIKYYRLSISKGYPYLKIGVKKCALHRFVMKISDPTQIVDHRPESNPFDCRKANLVVTDYSGNSDSKKTKNLGVSKNNNGFSAQIKKNGKAIFRYWSNHEDYCHRARDLFLLYHPQYHHLKKYKDWNLFNLKEEWLHRLKLYSNKYMRDVLPLKIG